jgi:hypothetical protein
VLDRLQAETYRRLRLFGEAPAAHFLDACRLMGSEADFLATTHLVAHSLRELDGGIRGVLASMLSDAQFASIRAAGDLKHKEQIEQVCTVLGLGVDDEIRELWWAYAGRLHRLTHRQSLAAPRPVDREFREWWSMAQAVIHRVCRQFETVFAEALPRVEALAARAAPSQGDLRELREQVPHGAVALDRFFAAATPGWFPLLREAGYFGNPPPLQPDQEGMVAYVPWAPGQYLVRLVAAGMDRAGVVALVKDLRTDNPAAHEAVVDIALACPPDLAADLAATVAEFLKSPFQWRLPFKARDLVVHFAHGGQVPSSLILLRSLVVPGPRSGRWTSTALLVELVPEVFPASGQTGLDLLADLLDEHLASDERTREQDFSYIWRPVLEAASPRDLRDGLAYALRDAAARVVEADPRRLSSVVAAFEARERTIFARLALDLIRRFPDEALVSERLGDRARFDDVNVEREYTMLAQDRFSALSPEVQQRIIGWIEAGPEADPEDEQAADTLGRWQLQQLSRLGDTLPAQWRQRYEELSERYGAPHEPRREMRVWGATSPVTKEELAALSVDEVVQYLRTWVPDNAIDAPSPEGLARVLQEVVAEASARFARGARRFSDVEPIYARAFVSALTTAAASEPLEWSPLLDFSNEVITKQRHRPGRDDDLVSGLDLGWESTWLDVIRLVTAGLRSRAIPVELRDQVWAVISTLADDAEPDRDYEERWGGGGMGPSGLSLNTIRGAAIHAVMQYCSWQAARKPEGQTPRIEPRVREVLDRHLDPAVERTATIRSVYGQWFAVLVGCDREWAAARTEEIFSVTGAQEALGRVAWESYLHHNRAWPDAFQLLRPQYAAAIELAISGDDGSDDDQREALIGHLLGLYLQEELELGDELLGRFFTHAPIELRASLIHAIGTDLMSADAVSNETLERLRVLWESRLAAAITLEDPAALHEFSGFAGWFVSAKLDAKWSLTQLMAILDAGGVVDPAFAVIARLAELRETHLNDVVQCLAGLIDVSTDPWLVAGSSGEIRTIMRAGLNADSQTVRRAARAATNRLVARGHSEFADLLR